MRPRRSTPLRRHERGRIAVTRGQMTENVAANVPMLKGPFNFFQIAYVTSDLERAARVLGASYGIGNFQVNRDVPIETTTGTARAHFALAFIGSQQLEIIQPAGGADGAYRDELPSEGFGMRMHHAGSLVTDAAEWESIRASVIASGHATPVGGVFSYEGVPLMHYLYADTRRLLGHYLEFMYQTEAGRDMFANVPRY